MGSLRAWVATNDVMGTSGTSGAAGNTAATDGKKVFVNKDFFLSLTSSQQNGLLLHEVLHMALLHIPRMGGRDQHYWNVAADIVVNDLILSNTKFKLTSIHLFQVSID